jgi:Hypothetical protein (DUF2513)
VSRIKSGDAMKRDMELMRKILLKIEKDYQPGKFNLSDLEIDGYDMPTIAEHCDLLFQQEFVHDYHALYSDNKLEAFSFGKLTAQGFDYLELIRNNAIWEKTKVEIEKESRPRTFDEIARVAGLLIGNVIKEINS